MAAGLQVFNASGQIRLEITDRLTRLIETYTLTCWNDYTSRFIPVTGLTDDGYWTLVYPGGNFVASIDDGGITVHSISNEANWSATVPFSLYRS